MHFRKAQKSDLKTIDAMMGALIDEIYVNESSHVRDVLKANFTGGAMEETLQDEQATLYVVEREGEVRGFLFGWLFFNTFTIYWIYCHPECRGRGAIKRLLDFVQKELEEAGCYKMEMWAYAEHNRFLKFANKLGFKSGQLIEKSMFGFSLQNIYKCMPGHEEIEKQKRIKIMGEAGQGVKLLSHTLASILARLGNKVSLTLDYDSAVRSGRISADLIYSDVDIENPIIDEADVLIKFTKTREWFPAKNLVIDEGMCGGQCVDCALQCKKGTQYGFENISMQKFGSKIFINMIALGRILKYIGINIMLVNIADLLPPKYVEKNIAAIKYGFSYRDGMA
jgi:Pyruvate/2-oxoacid:ferredoxin oxidoreductase gamma subunit/GNAT superfamily N-acetyltransferase